MMARVTANDIDTVMVKLVPENDSDAAILQILDGRDVSIASVGGVAGSDIPSSRIWMTLQFHPKIGRD